MLDWMTFFLAVACYLLGVRRGRMWGRLHQEELESALKQRTDEYVQAVHLNTLNCERARGWHEAAIRLRGVAASALRRDDA